MEFRRGIPGGEPAPTEPVGRSGMREIRPSARSSRLAEATLACPSCDAPVVFAEARALPSDRVMCPFCRHDGAVRDFLSFDKPTRPTRVEVHVRLRRPARREPAR